MKFTVKVPATSANLGPGFDALGLALDLWNETTIEADLETDSGWLSTDKRIKRISFSVSGEGAGLLALNEKNLIVRVIILSILSRVTKSWIEFLPSSLRSKASWRRSDEYLLAFLFAWDHTTTR